MSRRLAGIVAVLGALATSSSVAAYAALVERGRAVYAQWCVSCHGPGQHTPGTMALYFKYQGKLPPLLEHRGDLGADALRVFVRNGISVMPPFRRTEVSDPDIDALAAYLKDTSAKAPSPPARP
jgi:mono/diheme cytochrome c family protein